MRRKAQRKETAKERDDQLKELYQRIRPSFFQDVVAALGWGRRARVIPATGWMVLMVLSISIGQAGTQTTSYYTIPQLTAAQVSSSDDLRQLSSPSHLSPAPSGGAIDKPGARRWRIGPHAFSDGHPMQSGCHIQETQARCEDIKTLSFDMIKGRPSLSPSTPSPPPSCPTSPFHLPPLALLEFLSRMSLPVAPPALIWTHLEHLRAQTFTSQTLSTPSSTTSPLKMHASGTPFSRQFPLGDPAHASPPAPWTHLAQVFRGTLVHFPSDRCTLHPSMVVNWAVPQGMRVPL